MMRAEALRTTTPARIRCDGWAEAREVGCIAVASDHIVLSVWPDVVDANEFDEYRLPFDAEVEVFTP